MSTNESSAFLILPTTQQSSYNYTHTRPHSQNHIHKTKLGNDSKFEADNQFRKDVNQK